MKPGGVCVACTQTSLSELTMATTKMYSREGFENAIYERACFSGTKKSVRPVGKSSGSRCPVDRTNRTIEHRWPIAGFDHHFARNG